MTYITARSAIPIGFPVAEKPKREPMSEADLGTAMADMAKDDAKGRSKQRQWNINPQTPNTKPTPGQLRCLLVLKGKMTSEEIKQAIGPKGVKNISDALSALCTKGYTERCGKKGRNMIWRRTGKEVE